MARRQASYAEAADMLGELPIAVRVTRRARQLDLRATAELSGVSFNTISRIEAGKDCSLSNAVKLLHWLDSDQHAAPDADASPGVLGAEQDSETGASGE